MNKIKNLRCPKKALAIAGIALGAIIALLLVLILALHVITPIVTSEFFANSDPEYVTPGLYEGLVPQGYAYLEEEQIYLQCGYMTNSASASSSWVSSRLFRSCCNFS